MKSVLKIEFDNDAAMRHFANWLCAQGEQDYWIWMECREQEEKDDDITATEFQCIKDLNVIATVCGRLDKR